MAVTHDDLTVKERGADDVASQRGLFLMVFCVLCGFASFVFSLAAEATRSEATWLLLTIGGRDGKSYQCYYSGSGKTPLVCATLAFLALAVGMFTEHAYILITTGGPRPPALVLQAFSHGSSPASRGFTWRACFFFTTTWVCFSIAEVILMVGISAESGHLRDWSRPRSNCVVARQGLFAAAGVFALTTVFLAAGLYLTALQAQRLQDDEEHVRRQIPRASAPRLPRRGRAPPGSHRVLQGQADANQPSSEDPGNKTSTST
ncbi:hypothetical protein Taro_046938 [Colocasia esculenta]|uniref:Transmembrane protein n=1 Tax=Colocasia esculenta TaxID=4460 RepID=A0A843X7P4_COLES|nr:hypothetical protein [Colocasia esculenta]